jgi:MFS family permease
VIPSVLVSLSFAPILLAASPTPAFETTKAMSLKELYDVSPTGMVGMFIMGMVFAAQFGMASVYGTEADLSVAQISIFISAIFLGGLVLQYPFGWFSDRMDRRVLILAAAILGGVASAIGAMFGDMFEALLIAGFLIGGMSNPLYALLIAYTNDYLGTDDMAAASGGLIFVNGMGAITGPILTGWAMSVAGPAGFWLYLLVTFIVLSVYVMYRMTQRASAYREEEDYDAVAYAPVLPTATPVVLEAAQEFYAENADTEDQIAEGGRD